MQANDPITCLAGYLREYGVVPLAWAVTHAADGRLQVEWDRCEDWLAMTDLLVYVEHPSAYEARLHAAIAVLANDNSFPRDPRDEAECLDRAARAVRHVVPVAPTLTEIVAACERRRVA